MKLLRNLIVLIMCFGISPVMFSMDDPRLDEEQEQRTDEKIVYGTVKGNTTNVLLRHKPEKPYTPEQKNDIKFEFWNKPDSEKTIFIRFGNFENWVIPLSQDVLKGDPREGGLVSFRKRETESDWIPVDSGERIYSEDNITQFAWSARLDPKYVNDIDCYWFNYITKDVGAKKSVLHDKVFVRYGKDKQAQLRGEVDVYKFGRQTGTIPGAPQLGGLLSKISQTEGFKWTRGSALKTESGLPTRASVENDNMIWVPYLYANWDSEQDKILNYLRGLVFDIAAQKDVLNNDETAFDKFISDVEIKLSTIHLEKSQDILKHSVNNWTAWHECALWAVALDNENYSIISKIFNHLYRHLKDEYFDIDSLNRENSLKTMWGGVTPAAFLDENNPVHKLAQQALFQFYESEYFVKKVSQKELEQSEKEKEQEKELHEAKIKSREDYDNALLDLKNKFSNENPISKAIQEIKLFPEKVYTKYAALQDKEDEYRKKGHEYLLQYYNELKERSKPLVEKINEIGKHLENLDYEKLVEPLAEKAKALGQDFKGILQDAINDAHENDDFDQIESYLKEKLKEFEQEIQEKELAEKKRIEQEQQQLRLEKQQEEKAQLEQEQQLKLEKKQEEKARFEQERKSGLEKEQKIKAKKQKKKKDSPRKRVVEIYDPSVKQAAELFKKDIEEKELITYPDNFVQITNNYKQPIYIALAGKADKESDEMYSIAKWEEGEIEFQKNEKRIKFVGADNWVSHSIAKDSFISLDIMKLNFDERVKLAKDPINEIFISTEAKGPINLQDEDVQVIRILDESNKKPILLNVGKDKKINFDVVDSNAVTADDVLIAPYMAINTLKPFGELDKAFTPFQLVFNQDDWNKVMPISLEEISEESKTFVEEGTALKNILKTWASPVNLLSRQQKLLPKLLYYAIWFGNESAVRYLINNNYVNALTVNPYPDPEFPNQTLADFSSSLNFRLKKTDFIDKTRKDKLENIKNMLNNPESIK